MVRRLIINADDFGLTEGVSRGIIRAHREGVLTSTTFMVNFPWAALMAPLLKAAPDLGVGIHLNLTTGSPVLPAAEVPTLVNAEGRMRKSLWQIRFRVSPREALREWAAQVEKGIALLGRTPTHLDTHRYLQSIPALAAAMAEVARRFEIPAVRCLHPGPDLTQAMYSRWSPTGLLVGQALRSSLRVLDRSGLRFPSASMAGDFDLPGLLTRLERVGEGVTELVTHPGYVDDQLRSISSLQGQREIELAALTAPEVRDRIHNLKIQLIHFGHFASEGGV